MSKFERLHLVLNLIRIRPGIRSTELAQETGVSQRTIYRDILALAAQYPVLYNNGYRLLPTAHLKTLNLTRSEYNVLQMIFSCPALKRPDLKLAVRSLKAKIDTVVDPSIRSCARPSSHLCSGPVDNEHYLGKFQIICSIFEKAIDHCQIAEISSTKGSKRLTEEIYPYALVYQANCLPQGWFLIGYSPCIKEFKGLKLAPDYRVTLSSQSFQRDESFNLQEFFDSSWGIAGGETTVVKVRFTGEAALEVMEMNHHPKEKVIKVGENEAIYTVTVKGTNSILRWILGYGSEAEVLAPNFLREQIERIAKSIIKFYSKNAREVSEPKTLLTQD